MDLTLTKQEIIKQLMETDDISLLKHLKAIFDSRSGDYFAALPEEVQNSINRGIKDADNGFVKSHENVMLDFAKWRKK